MGKDTGPYSLRAGIFLVVWPECGCLDPFPLHSPISGRRSLPAVVVCWGGSLIQPCFPCNSTKPGPFSGNLSAARHSAHPRQLFAGFFTLGLSSLCSISYPAPFLQFLAACKPVFQGFTCLLILSKRFTFPKPLWAGFLISKLQVFPTLHNCANEISEPV